jgi:hypothetical protein
MHNRYVGTDEDKFLRTKVKKFLSERSSKI